MAGSIVNKKSSASVLVLALLVACANLPQQMQAAISCGTVDSDLAPCIPYAEGKVAAPSAACCNGVKSLYAATKPSRPDRMTACNCIKSVISGLGGAVNQGNVAALPGKCGVSLGYTIGPSTNCATIP